MSKCVFDALDRDQWSALTPDFSKPRFFVRRRLISALESGAFFWAGLQAAQAGTLRLYLGLILDAVLGLILGCILDLKIGSPGMGVGAPELEI